MSEAPEAAAPARRELNPVIRLLLDLGPLVLFFIAFQLADIYVATGVFMAAFLVAVAASWLMIRHVPTMTWFSGALVLVFGGLTLWLHDETFIKMKPTILFAGFGLALGFASLTGRNYLKLLMQKALEGLSDRGWALLQKRWALFFLALAIANEVLWRGFPTDIWIHFKVWGDTLLTILFMLLQFPMLKREGLKLD
jgi:intracellular septation protein